VHQPHIIAGQAYLLHGNISCRAFVKTPEINFEEISMQTTTDSLTALAKSAARLATLTGKAPEYPLMMSIVLDNDVDTVKADTKDNRWDLTELRRLYETSSTKMTDLFPS